MVSESLQGKNYVVTGANSGIGFIAARRFAELGASVALVCRNEGKGLRALEQIAAASGNEKLSLHLADFASLASVNAMADRLLQAMPSIDVLCNNAGGANGKRLVTQEGFETTFVCNHLSGFLLSQKLMPALLEAASVDSARVVFTSSYGHFNSALEFDDLGLEQNYTTLKAYGRTKLMNLLVAREMQKRFGQQGIVASSFHPGAVRTPIWSKSGNLARLLGLLMYPFMVDIESGADTLIWLAVSNDATSQNAAGQYFYKRKRAKTAEFVSDEDARRLWQTSEELIAPYYQNAAKFRS